MNLIFRFAVVDVVTAKPNVRPEQKGLRRRSRGGGPLTGIHSTDILIVCL